MTVFTVDVSHHDWDRSKGEIDWQAIARFGIVAACVRATYGDPKGFSPTSRHAGEMIRGARAAGLITGAYHNLAHGDAASIRRQVDWLRSEMDRHGATWAMLDVERYEELLARDLQPRIGDVRAFCVRWRTVDTRPLLVYLPRWVWVHLGSPNLRDLNCPLVASDYGANRSATPITLYVARGGDDGRGWQPYGGVTPTLWQFGSRARVPGLGPPTDVNAFRGTIDQLHTLLTPDQEDNMPTVDEIWQSDRIQRYDADGVPVPASDSNPKMTADFALGWAVREATLARAAARQLVLDVAALRGVIEQLAAIIQAGGGSVDTAVILTGVDERLAAARADLRDAVADLGEGGAAQVRAL